MSRKKLSDLRPPLGINKCNLYERVKDTVPRIDQNSPSKIVEDVVSLYQTIQEGEDLSKSLEHKIYKPFVEKLPRLDFFKEVYLTAHAQYRMDYRGVSVKELQDILSRYEERLKKSRQSQRAFRKLILNSGGSLKKTLMDKKSGVRLVMVITLNERDVRKKVKENDFDVFKEVKLITLYYAGSFVNGFPSMSKCKTLPHLFNDLEYLDKYEKNLDDNKSKFATTEFIYGKLSQANIEIQEIVKQPLGKALDLPLNPYPSYETSLSELVAIKYMQADTQDWAFVNFADKDIVGVFVDYLLELGILESGLYLDLDIIGKELIPIILKLKYFYNRPRPYQYAQKAGVDFKALGFESAKTPSYPSGHTMQAVYMSEYLSDRYPQHARELRDLARKVSKSRIQAGEHFPSDCLFGAHLARLLYRGLPLTMKVSSNNKEHTQKIIKQLDTSDLRNINQILGLADALDVNTVFEPQDNLFELLEDHIYEHVNDKTPNKCLDMSNLDFDHVQGVVAKGSLVIEGKLSWNFWLEGGRLEAECAETLEKEFGAEIVYQTYVPDTDEYLYEIELNNNFTFKIQDNKVSVKLG